MDYGYILWFQVSTKSQLGSHEALLRSFTKMANEYKEINRYRRLLLAPPLKVYKAFYKSSANNKNCQSPSWQRKLKLLGGKICIFNT